MPDATATVAPSQIEALRGFNRFYIRHIGILAPYPGGDLTLTEVRVLYELAQRAASTRAVLHEIGIGEAEVQELIDSGVASESWSHEYLPS